MASSSHAEIADVLTRAIHTVFSECTALGMAVENEWGGRNTRDKALALLQQAPPHWESRAAVARTEPRAREYARDLIIIFTCARACVENTTAASAAGKRCWEHPRRRSVSLPNTQLGRRRCATGC